MTRVAVVLRRAAQEVAIWAPSVCVLLTWILLRDDLPQTMATQWSGSTAGGWTPTIFVVAATAGVSVTAAACAGRSERRRVWIAVGFSALSACVWLVLAVGNVQPTPYIGGWGLLTPLAFLYGGVPAALTRPTRPRAVEAVYETAGTDEVEPASRARDWVVSPVNCALAILAGCAAGVSAAVMHQTGVGIALAVVAVVSAEFGIIRIKLTATRLVVFGAVPGIPLYSIGSGRVGFIERVDVRPFEWGGWGYRFGRSGAGIILRGGPGVRIHPTTGVAFTVNARHPERFTNSHGPARNASSAS